ncbi:MAG: GNAT family N-acetyltransferase [Armatimonadetes bacterium]|nr:GNAT family N-acetyltransferase [Armatimonadota bacterium]
MRGYSNLTFETERLHLRAWRVSDAEEAFEIYGDPQVAEYLTGIPEASVDTQRALLEKIILGYDNLDKGMGSFPMIEKKSGRLIGAILLKPLPRTEDFEAWVRFRDGLADGATPETPPIHEIEIGWHLGRSSWGNGYATEGARALAEHGFTVLGLDEIHAVLYAANKPSARVAGRLGMRHAETTDRFYGRELEHYVMTPSDFSGGVGAGQS